MKSLVVAIIGILSCPWSSAQMVDSFILLRTVDRSERSVLSEASKLFQDDQLLVWTSSTDTLLSTLDHKIRSRLYIEQGAHIRVYEKRLDGAILDVGYDELFGDSAHKLIRVNWDFRGGYGTAGVDGEGISLWYIGDDKVEDLIDETTKFGSASLGTEASVMPYLDNGEYKVFVRSYSGGDGPLFCKVGVYVLGHLGGKVNKARFESFGLTLYASSNGAFVFHLKDSRVNLRAGGGIKNKVVQLLSGKEELTLLSSGPVADQVQGVDGYWVNVATETGISGWVWSAYIE